MRAVLKILLLVALLPVLYVATAAVYLPAIVWHRNFAPHSSALMRIRLTEAATADRELELRHRWVPLDSISPHLMHAVLAAEDTRFYEHHGFDWEQIREAWEANRSGRPLRGASTITQQTVKNLYLSPSRNVFRKAREALLTVWMEAWLPKDRILELYLNVVELGPGIFGAEAASRTYFGRSAATLTRGQAAMLAATLPGPLLRNPGRPTGALHRRQRMILARMSRWYEGPSLAEEEAAGEIDLRDPATVDRVESAPIDLDALEDDPSEATGPEEDAAAESPDGEPAEETVPAPGQIPAPEPLGETDAGPREAEAVPVPVDTSAP